MNTYETLKRALEERIPLTAELLLLSGEHRKRETVIVAALNLVTVTFFEAGKGFRSAPLSLVQRVSLEPEQKPIADALYSILDAKAL